MKSTPALGAGRLVTAILDELDPICVATGSGLVAGDPVALVDEGGIMKATNIKGKTIAEFFGIIICDNDRNADGTFDTTKMHTVIQEGEVTVYVATGDPVKGGKVYINLTTGAFTAVSAGASELTGAVWYRSGVDAGRIGVVKLK